MAANMGGVDEKKSITLTEAMAKDTSLEPVKITSLDYYTVFKEGKFSLLNYLEWKKWRNALMTIFTREDYDGVNDANVIVVSAQVWARLRKLFHPEITLEELKEKLEASRFAIETKAKWNEILRKQKKHPLLAMNSENPDQVEITCSDYCALIKSDKSSIFIYREWKEFKHFLVTTIFTPQECILTGDENVIYLSQSALAQLNEAFYSEITLDKLKERLKALRSPENVTVKEVDRFYRAGQSSGGFFELPPLDSSLILEKIAGFQVQNSQYQLKHLTHTSTQHSRRASQSQSTHFARPRIGLPELCEALNEIKIFNREFVLLEQFSGKHNPHLRMNCKGLNDSEVMEFITLLHRCSVDVNKGQSSEGSRIIVIRGVKNEEKFLQAEKQLKDFAQKHQPAAVTFIRPEPLRH